MKHLSSIILPALLAVIVFGSCYKDNGNYNYIPEDQLSIIEIDTIGVGSDVRFAFNLDRTPGDTVVVKGIKIKYDYPEDLKYSYIIYPYPYNSVAVGNTTEWPQPDTICRTLDCSYIVDLPAGRYTATLLVQDTVRGPFAMLPWTGYFNVNVLGAKNGAYILSEYDGKTDIDYYRSALCLIYGGDEVIPHYYSDVCGGGMLPGKPKFIYRGGSYFYAFTEDGGYRLNNAGLVTMETFNEMFYNVPTYNPQAMSNINNCEFLINNGKMHVMYTNRTNDRKFSAAIGGDYVAAPFFNDATRTTWQPTVGAIDADQIIYDTKNKCFRPYFALDTEVRAFNPTLPDAYVDANLLPANPVWIGGGEGNKTYAIVDNEGKRYLYRYNFYNVLDDGDLSSDGANSVIDLSGCTDIYNAKYYVANLHGSAFFYATDNVVYSFSPSSGSTTSNTVYTPDAGDTVTCLQIFARVSGGAPSFGCVLWIGVWNESRKEGKLVEMEVDPYSGVPRMQWIPMFAPTHTNPYITTGYGKIKSIAASSVY